MKCKKGGYMITIYFDKLYAIERLDEPCMISVPLQKGQLFSIDEVQIFQENKPVPTQTKITAVWNDGSVKYLFCRFLATLPANQSVCVYLALTKNDYPSVIASKIHQSPLEVHSTVNGFEVKTGELSFSVENDSSNLFSVCEAHSYIYEKNQFVGPLLQDNACNSYRMQYGTWSLIEKGDVCTILSCKGQLRDEIHHSLPCEIRITAYAKKDWIDLSVRLINATSHPLVITKYCFQIMDYASDTLPRTCVASSNYKTDFLTSDKGETVKKEITPQSLVYQSNEHFGEVFYGTFFADYNTSSHGICGTIFQAYQNYPKAIEANQEGITLFLVPEGENFVTMQSGMAREQRFQLYFHDVAETLSQINHRTIVYQMPDRPYLSSEVYEKANVFPDIFVKNKELQTEYTLILAGDAHARCYGMMNWGDTPDPNYTAQGRGNGQLVWTNNEYDFPHACMLMYAKSGLRRFQDYCLIAGNHQIDVDVCHYSDDPLILGGQWEHTQGHCQNGVMVCSHQWVEGILDCYHLTGDERYLETAIGIGNNILRLLDTPMYQNEASFNARETGWALRTLTALYTETCDSKWTIKSEWIVNQFADWAKHYGGWLAPYTDNVVIRIPFMISVAIGSLMRYYRVFPSEKIKHLILSAVDDMVSHCILDNGLFFYKELPSLNRPGNNPLVLEALTIAYDLTDDPKYLSYGLATYQAVIRQFGQGKGGNKKIIEDTVIVGSTGTKSFAQGFIPVATFYRALEKSGLLTPLL